MDKGYKKEVIFAFVVVNTTENSTGNLKTVPP
jgi:hypothetical protein